MMATLKPAPNNGHRFAGDPDEAPRCLRCDARAGGTAAAQPCPDNDPDQGENNE